MRGFYHKWNFIGFSVMGSFNDGCSLIKKVVYDALITLPSNTGYLNYLTIDFSGMLFDILLILNE